MSNHIEAVRRLARTVAAGAASAVVRDLFRVYLIAAGAEVRGPWAYIPGCSKSIKGWVSAAAYVADLDETSAFLRAMANAHALVERVIGPSEVPAPATSQTASELLAVAEQVSDLARQLAARVPSAPDPEAVVIGDEASLGALAIGARELFDRTTKRAIYTAGKTLLEGIDAWVALATRENAADAEHFHADDVRTMVNDMCRELGAPAPWRP
jgi:hypothetical protein